MRQKLSVVALAIASVLSLVVVLSDSAARPTVSNLERTQTEEKETLAQVVEELNRLWIIRNQSLEIEKVYGDLLSYAHQLLQKQHVGTSVRIGNTTITHISTSFSATLSDPTEDGHIMFDGATDYTRDSGILMYVGLDSGYYFRAYVGWDISSIPDSATITDTVFKYHGKTHASDCHIHEMLGCRPSVQPDNDAGNQAIYDEAGEGTVYADPAGFPEAGTGKEQDLGTSADSDLQSQLPSDWFAIGIQSDNEAISAYSTIYSEEYASADPKPTLYVVYMVGDAPNKPTNLQPSVRQITTSVTISANATDNDGDEMNVHFYGIHSLSDPTEDGMIAFQGFTYSRINAGEIIAVKGRTTPDEWLSRWRAYIEWDISAIPDTATIIDTVFKYHGDNHGGDNCEIRAIENRPSTSNDETVYNDIGDGTIYDSPANFIIIGENQEIGLSSNHICLPCLAACLWPPSDKKVKKKRRFPGGRQEPDSSCACRNSSCQLDWLRGHL